jgi:putative acetyltransferase
VDAPGTHRTDKETTIVTNTKHHSAHPSGVVIREELPTDIDPITDLTIAAFAGFEIGERTEQHVITALRAANALTISLVAELEGRIVGHVAFSPVTISDGTTGWFELGPVSVMPVQQNRGIGSFLICEGLDRLRGLGADGCCLVGHPAYYPRFGFIHRDNLTHGGVPPEVFFVMSFTGHWPQGEVTEHPAFSATE